MVLPQKMAALPPISETKFRINPLAQAVKISLEKPRKPTLRMFFRVKRSSSRSKKATSLGRYRGIGYLWRTRWR
jgi:hypothetical protein